MNDVMIDLETMGDSAGDVIVSIGAVQFDIETGELGKEFYKEIKWSTCLNEGLGVKASTICWWLQQNEQAKNKVIRAESDGMSISQVLYMFRSFLHHNMLPKETKIWGNSNRFDLGILAAAYQKIFPGGTLPWDFRNERDVRTIAAYYPQIKAEMPFEGIEHDPIADCKHQIKYLVKIHSELTKSKIIEKEVTIEQEFTYIPMYLYIDTFDEYVTPGRGGSSFYIPFDKPFKVGDLISPIPNSNQYPLYVIETSKYGNKVVVAQIDEKYNYFPKQYLKPKQKFYKINFQ